MISEEAILTRNKILGVLLRKARLDAHKSIEECAKALACDPAYVTRAEEGMEALTLPQVESLARILNVPLESLIDNGDSIAEAEPEPESLPYQDMMLIRRRIIGIILRQARQEAGRTLDEVAPGLGYTPEYLARIELGEAQIPLVRLQMLADVLGIPFREFTSESVLPSETEEPDERDLVVLDHLPEDVREFILKPINIPYLQIAMNLSQMPAETLRQIASGLLEITY